MDGEHKNGVEIIVSYQAVNEATGKTVTMDVYDEAFALDAVKSVAEMTEVVATGRYKAAFTPDAEGEWIVVMKNTTDGNGAVVKAFSVGGHNVDGIGDAIVTVDGKVDTVDGKIDTVDTVVDAIKAVTDVETGVKAAVDALQDISTANVATELATYDAPTKAEMDTKIDALTDIDSDGVNAACDTALSDYDAATGAEVATVDGKVDALTDITPAQVATELETYDAVKKSELDAVQGGSETLETIKSAVDSISSPAMVG